MSLFPRGFGKGLLVGGTMAALWWALSDRRRRTAIVGQVVDKVETLPFPGTRIHALLPGQLMGDIHRAVAEDVVSKARRGDLLEIGSGPGYLAMEIGRRARDLQITAMDRSPDVVRGAESRIHALGLGRQVKVALGDARDIPFPDGAFDFVLSLGSLHHWRAPDLVFDEIYRVLKPGGRAWIYDLRREMPETGWEEIRQSVPLMMRPLFELGAVGSWRAAYTEGQICDVVASSPFSQAEIEVLTVEIAGKRAPALTRVTLRK